MSRINRLTDFQAAGVFTVAGVVTFFTGLGNPFIGDDLTQIVNNPQAHSIANIGQFFTGGTFYSGQGALQGVNYRPLQTTGYALLYTIFGSSTVPFHLLQLMLCVASAFILYKFLKYSFNTGLAFFLSLIFLVYPINSQIVFDVAKLGDVLFFFFGITAMWLLLRFRSTESLLAVAVCLFLSLLSKETGILFVAMALLYLIGFDRKRLYPFIGIIVLPVTLYLALKINAVGLTSNPNNAPIDNLGLGSRLINAPSVVLFYIAKFVWPLPLASQYYWVHSTLNFQDFVLPLAIDIAVVSIGIYAGLVVRRKGTRAQHRTFVFFAAWLVVGLLAHLQIIPLDMTASETYLYFPMVGILGMTGIGISVWSPVVRVDRRMVMAAGTLLVVLLALRTSLRGMDWSDAYNLAQHDVAVSTDDFNADIIVAYKLAQQGDLGQAREHAAHSVSVYPTYEGYVALGSMLTYSQDYARAKDAFLAAIKYENTYQVSAADAPVASDDLAVLTMWYGDYSSNKSFLESALQVFPGDGRLWYYLAILLQRNNDNADAKIAIANAYNLGVVDQSLLSRITNNQPVSVPPRPALPRVLPQF